MSRLYQEVAFLGYYLHWPLQDILNLEHGDRIAYIDEVSRINREVSRDPNKPENMFDVF